MNFIAKVLRLRFSDYLLLLKIYGLLHLSKWYIEYQSLKEIVQWIERQDLENKTPTLEEIRFAKKVARYTNFLAHFTLFKSKCYDKALTVKKILNRENIPSELLMGVKTSDEKDMEAHAWVKCNHQPIIGGKAAIGYTPVRSFF